jgi:hypothetical protein
MLDQLPTERQLAENTSVSTQQAAQIRSILVDFVGQSQLTQIGLFSTPQKQFLAQTINTLQPTIKTILAVRQELISILHITIITTQKLIRHRNQRFYMDSKRSSQLDKDSENQVDEEGSNTARAAPSFNRFHPLDTFEVELNDTPIAQIFHQFPERQYILPNSNYEQLKLELQNIIEDNSFNIFGLRHSDGQRIPINYDVQSNQFIIWRKDSVIGPLEYDSTAKRITVTVLTPQLGEYIYSQRAKTLLIKGAQILRAGGFTILQQSLNGIPVRPFFPFLQDFKDYLSHIHTFSDLIVFINWHIRTDITSRLLETFQWLITSGTILSHPVILQELNDYKGIIAEDLSQGTQFTIRLYNGKLRKPSSRNSAVKISQDVKVNEIDLIKFQFQNRVTLASTFIRYKQEVNQVIDQINSQRAIKQINLWTDLREHILLLKRQILDDKDLSQYHIYQFKIKLTQISDKITNIISQLRYATSNTGNLRDSSQQLLTNFFSTTDPGNTFDTYD